MEIEFTQRAYKELQDWKKSGNTSIIKRITELTASVLESPFAGIGKPEPLKHQYSGKWSRRINKEHRYVYEVRGDYIHFFSKGTLHIIATFSSQLFQHPAVP